MTMGTLSALCWEIMRVVLIVAAILFLVVGSAYYLQSSIEGSGSSGAATLTPEPVAVEFDEEDAPGGTDP